MSSDYQTNTPPEPPSKRRQHSIVLPIILIILGILLLLSNLGYLPPGFWANAWRFWPVILILVGLEVLIGRRSAWAAAGTVIGVVIVIVIVSAILFLTGVFTWGQANLPWIGGGHFVQGSGNQVTQQRDIRDFDEVRVSGPFEVDIERSDSFLVEITADDNLVDKIQTSKNGRELSIGVAGTTIVGGATLKARITTPELRRLSLNGAESGRISGFDSVKDFGLVVSGASSAQGRIGAQRIAIEVSGASKVTLEGSADNARLEASGASTLNLENLTVREADADISGASRATISVTDTLSAEVSGASNLTYIGNPTLRRVSTSGGSTINRR